MEEDGEGAAYVRLSRAASEDLGVQEEEQDSGRFLVCLALLSLSGGAIYGMNVAASAYSDDVKEEFDLGTAGETLISSAATITDALSMLVVGAFFLDRWGRRSTVTLAGTCNIVGCLIGAFSNSFEALVCARLIQGMGNGMSILAVPMLISESAPKKRRSWFVSFFQVGVVFGFALPFAVQLLFSNWHVTVAAGAVPGLLLMGLLMAIWTKVESPAWLALRESDRRASVAAAESDPESQQLLATARSMQESQDELVAFPAAALLCLVLAFTNNSSDAIVFYGPKIIEKAHIGHEKSLWTSLIIALINVPAVAIVLAIIHKLSRRLLLLSGLAVIVLCYLTLGACYLNGVDDHHGLIIFMVLVLMIAFQFGPGTLFVVILPEIFTQRKRARGMAIGTVAMSVFSILCNGSMPALMEALGPDEIGAGRTFLLYGSLYLISFIILAAFLPETRYVKIAPGSGMH